MTWCTSKNTERHTAHTIVSWPNPKQWVIVHTSDSMMIIRQSIYILSIITREMGQLKTYSPTCFVMDNWENMPYLTHTLDKLYLTGILWVQCLQIRLVIINKVWAILRIYAQRVLSLVWGTVPFFCTNNGPQFSFSDDSQPRVGDVVLRMSCYLAENQVWIY